MVETSQDCPWPKVLTTTPVAGRRRRTFHRFRQRSRACCFWHLASRASCFKASLAARSHCHSLLHLDSPHVIIISPPHCVSLVFLALLSAISSSALATTHHTTPSCHGRNKISSSTMTRRKHVLCAWKSSTSQTKASGHARVGTRYVARATFRARLHSSYGCNRFANSVITT